MILLISFLVWFGLWAQGFFLAVLGGSYVVLGIEPSAHSSSPSHASETKRREALEAFRCLWAARRTGPTAAHEAARPQLPAHSACPPSLAAAVLGGAHRRALHQVVDVAFHDMKVLLYVVEVLRALVHGPRGPGMLDAAHQPDGLAHGVPATAPFSDKGAAGRTGLAPTARCAAAQ